MANNYLSFSEMIYDLNDEEQLWWNFETNAERDDLTEEEFEDLQAQWKELGGDYEPGLWPGFNWSLERGSGKTNLWLYAEEYGDLDNLMALVQEFLATFRPNDSFGLTWSEICSKPRIGEFGGGCLFITANEVKTMGSHMALENFKKEREDEIKK